MNDDLFADIADHLAEEQFRRRVMLFQRCDNVLRPLLANLEEISPRTDEELAVYIAFLTAARTILAEMAPFLPEKTHQTLTGRLASYEARMKRDMRQND